MVHGPAMTRAQAEQAIQAGIDLMGEMKERGYQLIATGEMGIGNTTASTALAKKCRHLVMVTNDVFSDGVACAESTQEYLRQLAAINAQAAALADCVVEVVGGKPQIFDVLFPAEGRGGRCCPSSSPAVLCVIAQEAGQVTRCVCGIGVRIK